MEEDSRSGSNNNNNKDNAPNIRLGLRPNINQFLILILVNAFVGAMIGMEQTVVPLIGINEFRIESNALIVSFIASFGAVKAILNLFAVDQSACQIDREEKGCWYWDGHLAYLFHLSYYSPLDYFCQYIAWNKPRAGLVYDCKYEN